jgi:hypothetical protein
MLIGKKAAGMVVSVIFWSEEELMPACSTENSLATLTKTLCLVIANPLPIHE